MSDKIPPRFRKTKSDKWAVMAPVEDLEKALAEGGRIDVQKRSGDWSSFVVASLGKPFDVDGVEMCYGYGPDDGDNDSSTDGGDTQKTTAPRSSNGGARERSSRRPAAPVDAPPADPTEPLPEYQGGPEDEWDGYF
ncbi:MAG: hypothetical protein OES24_08800 [Acidimicrobiia bacterium]|nr:hypothetical protein [Acidimicrobiia bacterium]